MENDSGRGRGGRGRFRGFGRSNDNNSRGGVRGWFRGFGRSNDDNSRGGFRGSGRSPGRQQFTFDQREPGEKTVPKAARRLQVGEISVLMSKENFGYIKVEGETHSVKFRYGDGSKTDTGLLDVEIGDVLQYTLNDSGERPRAVYARLVQCKRRSPLVLGQYLDKLLIMSADSPGKVLREITKCPVGFLLVLELRQQSLSLVFSVLKLADILHQEGASFYGARVKQFYKFFSGAEFLKSSGAFKEYVLCRISSEDRLSLIKKFILRLVAVSPESGSDLLPLIESMIEALEEDNNTPSSFCVFLVEILRCYAGAEAAVSSEKPPDWDKLPLVPVHAEMAEPFKSLPCVKKKGSYGSVDEYLDTYYTLLREDCFAPLRKGLADLKANKLDPRDMKVWINGSVLGIHFSRRNPGITFAITAQRHSGKGPAQLPMPGTLLCISDDGGNFNSPIWGVVARCEEDKNSRVIFVEAVDGKAGSGGSSVQCISRLLGASDLVFVENPTFYKAYEPVLRGLQQMDCHNFPFREEFVDTKWTNQPAEYLSDPATTVNWGCLFGETSVRSGIGDLDNLIKGGYRTTLDESQRNAVRHAIKNRLVLIQGPPGTGKSFVGVKILEIVLSADTLPAGPALVVTYKNQGLDHFLLSCLKFCPEDLVRVGGRSTERSLDKFNLFSLIPKYDEFSPDCFDNTKKLEDTQTKIEEALKQLQGSRVSNSVSVVNHMSEFQLRQLISKGNLCPPDLVPEEEISLADFLAEDSSGSKNLQQVIFQTLKDWMPSQKTFQLVQDCFSRQKASGAVLKQVATRCATDKPFTDLDEEKEDYGSFLIEQFLQAKPEEKEEEEDPDEPDEKSKKGGKKSEYVWLKENFFTYKPQASDANSSTGSNDIDFDQYHWLLDEDPWDLNESHRVILVLLIMQITHEKAVKKLEEAKKVYDEICQDTGEINKRRQLEVLKKAKIVGMTTTGAALNQEILKALNPSIVFVEEAAEVLEPQLLAVLGPSVQHLIIIGDHYQLSPSVEVYELERSHGFAVSLFERLVEHNKMPFQALSSQSRMREEFVPMILPIYPSLRTNTQFVSGERNKAPVCMTSPMYFWSHSYEESKERSVANQGEAKMVIALVRWMIAEGQNPEEITVLAPYNGQVTLIRDMLKVIPDIEALQVLTVDRFQGSENKVIILSLVRSNDKGSIGHLEKRNRLCVAVSRARGGMYFCGNDICLTKKSGHWTELLEYLSQMNCVGNTMYLRCPRHPRSPPFAISSKLIDNFNPLLCKRTCNSQRLCGHYCQSTCHYGDHPKCTEPVQFTFSVCGHETAKKCSEDEEKLLCQQELMHMFDSCGHKKFVKCWEKNRKELKCSEPCRNVLDCGHPCMLKCFENCKAKPCSICIEIQKKEAEKARRLEAQQLKMKLEEIRAEIKRLEGLSDGPDKLVTDISPTEESAAEYFQVMDRTEKFIQPGHDVVLIVTRIQKVFNPKLQINFLKAQRDLFQPTSSSQQLFHGTDDAGVKGITQDGFRLPQENSRNMFGRGCYFATDSTKSAQNIYTKGSNRLLLCDVLLGRTWTVQEDHPEMDRDQIRRKGYDSLFSKRGGRGTGGTLYDEYVIYNPHQAIPRYIVHFKNQHDPQALQAYNFLNNLTRISYEPSFTFNGDNSGEYHFRQAESQFYRMSSRRDQKVVKVELILNKILQRRYDTARQELQKNNGKVKEMFVFHGTDKSAIEKIVEEGFRIGGQGVSVRNGAAYGTGVYTALDPDISANYSKGSGMMLLSLALVGQEGIHYNKGGSEDVFVLQNADHLLPKYIVHFAING